jgi:transposase
MDLYLDRLLNLPNTTVKSFTEEENKIVLKLQFLHDEIVCPHCNTQNGKLKQNRPILIRDLSVFGKVVYLNTPRRQFYCQHCQKHFTEKLPFVDWERRYTQRYEEYVYQRVQSASVEQVSRDELLSWDQVQGIFNHQFSLKKKDNWEEVKRVSIDEVSKRKGHQNFVTVVSNIDAGELLEVIDSHKQDDIIEVLKQQPIEIREKVEEVSVDMWGGFPKVVKEVFPNAKIVIDRFHVMQPLIKELNQLRQKAKIKIKGSRFILLKNKVDLTEEEKVKLENILKCSKRLRLAYNLKEDFRNIFETCKTPDEGQKQLEEWLQKAKTVYGAVLETIRNHLDNICNYFLNRTSSGVMEGLNNRIKLIKRQAYGFLNFINFRSRLLACLSH